MACSEVSWLDEGHTLKELLDYARQMLQTRRLPYLVDWDVTDELLENLSIPMARAQP